MLATMTPPSYMPEHAGLGMAKGRFTFVTSKIRELKRAGDVGGVKAWSQVAIKLEDFEDSRTGGQDGKSLYY
jgi:hypothetical protein